MKKLLFYIAAMAITIGCSDQIEEGLSTDPATPSEGTVPVKLYLTSEGDSAASRVVINDDLSVDWQVGDKIVAYSLEQKKTTEIYAKADETTGELYFEGELYTGKNRIYTGNVYNKNSDYAYVCLFTMLSTGSSTPIYPKMVSSDVIEIEESEDATVIKSYDIYMQHISAMVKLNLTFKNTPTDWAAILGDGFKISEIRLGGSPDSSTTEGDEYVDVMTYVKTDPTKGALEDGFLLEADGVYNYNISYSTSFLDSYTTPNYIADGDMLSIELAVDPSTFIIEDGEKLRIRLTFNPENSGDFNNIYVVDYISNNSGETFEAARATYNTINKTFDLGPVVYGDTWPNYAAESFAGGAGTSESPYQIATAEQLAYLSKVVALGGDSTDTYYELTDNINLEGQEWYPIGDSDNPFKGNFDGNDKSISNLTINITSSYQGLFGYAIAATIESVTLSEPSISGSSYVGAICGYAKGNSDNKGTTISKCSVDGGSVTGSSYVGAICGYAKGNSDNKGTTISKCCVDGGSVAGSSCVGAICGYAKGTTISKCCVDGGSVTGSGHVGGVVGENYTYSTVTECYNTGSVTGKSIYTGGVVGYNNTYSTVTECYNTGDVEGSSNCVGGVVGYNRDNSTVKECYNTGDVEGSSGYVGGVVGYNSNSSTATACYNTGSVEGSDYVGGVVGCNYSSSTATECYNTGSVTGKGIYTGGVVGNNRDNSTVKECYNTGEVESSSDYVGGVVGYCDDSTVTSCYNRGDIGSRTSYYVGGIIGYTSSSSCSLTACYNIGDVNGSAYIGGIVGGIKTDSTDPTVTACYYIIKTNGAALHILYGTQLNTVQALNNLVETMNSAAGDDYYTAGSPSDSVIPWLFDEAIERYEYEDYYTLEGYTPGGSLNGDLSL